MCIATIQPKDRHYIVYPDLLFKCSTCMVNPSDALCFHRRCKYGGEDEYYVQTRETGNKQQERVDTEHHEEVTQETQTLIPAQLLTYFSK